jgi:hypothetical protein
MDSEDPSLTTLLFLYYLRYLATDKGGSLIAFNAWIDIEELIKNIELNEYWRYALAMELV